MSSSRLALLGLQLGRRALQPPATALFSPPLPPQQWRQQGQPEQAGQRQLRQGQGWRLPYLPEARLSPLSPIHNDLHKLITEVSRQTLKGQPAVAVVACDSVAFGATPLTCLSMLLLHADDNRRAFSSASRLAPPSAAGQARAARAACGSDPAVPPAAAAIAAACPSAAHGSGAGHAGSRH